MKKSLKKESRSITRSDVSFASTATSSSSNDSTTRSVLPDLLPAGKPSSANGSDDYWLLSPASSSVSDLFTIFNHDGDNKIMRQELEAVFRHLGGADPPTEEEVASMVEEVDCDGDWCISLEEFGAIGLAFGPPAGAEILPSPSLSKKSSKKKESRSITRSDASFISTATSSSSNDSTTRSILHDLSPAGKPPSTNGSDDYWLLYPAFSSVSDLFAIFDRDGDGKIMRHELEAVFCHLGGADPPMKEAIKLMVEEVDG